MTRTKAIERLNDAKIKIKIPKAAVTARETNDALDMAIEALENENALIDHVLEIIDKESRYISSKEAYRNAACQDYWRSITSIRRAIEELRGNNKQ